MVDPILKWAGGKRQLLIDIFSLLPINYKEIKIHEPFFGGGAFTFRLIPLKGTINDINSKLVNFYIVVKDYVEELIEDAQNHKNQAEYYYNARAEFNEIVRKGYQPPHIRLASLLLYLNKTAYNGLYRENSKGEFNVPFGKYKNPTIVNEKRLRKASQILKRLEIFNTDFNYLLKTAEEGDLVYLDPPYHPLSKTSSFTSYSKKNFGLGDQKRLKETCEKLDEKGVYFILSNSYSPEVLDLYQGIKNFELITVYAARAINSKADRRGKIKEILITNIPKEKRVGKEHALTLLNRKE